MNVRICPDLIEAGAQELWKVRWRSVMGFEAVRGLLERGQHRCHAF